MLPSNYIPISNSPFTGLKRALEWQSFSVRKTEQICVLDSVCHFFQADSNSPDGYGNEIANLEIKSVNKSLIESNNQLVNPANGICCCQSITSGDTVTYTDLLGNVVDTPIGQFDYFLMVMNQPIKVSDLIAQILQLEDSIYQTYNH